MAILRAGPWGELDDKFQDPISTPTSTLPAPVNCAKGDWPNQDWGAVYGTDNSPAGEPATYEYGIVELGESVELETSLGGIAIVFCWQATEEFSVDLNWSFVGGSQLLYPSLFWSYETTEEDDDSYSHTPGNSGTETVTLPATTFGRFRFYVGAFDSDLFDVTASIS